MWATGEVSGHGRFVIKAFKVPVTVGQLRIVPGDLLMADSGGVRKTKSYYFSRNAAEVTSLLRLCVAIMPYFLRMIQGLNSSYQIGPLVDTAPHTDT